MQYIIRKSNKNAMSHPYRHAWLSLVEQKEVRLLRKTHLRIRQKLEVINCHKENNTIFYLLLNGNDSGGIDPGYLMLIEKERSLLNVLYSIEKKLHCIFFKYPVVHNMRSTVRRSIHSFSEKECVNLFRFRKDDLLKLRQCLKLTDETIIVQSIEPRRTLKFIADEVLLIGLWRLVSKDDLFKATIIHSIIHYRIFRKNVLRGF